ncbi:MAG: sensor histidine kinase [Pseudomonadota bacterium]
MIRTSSFSGYFEWGAAPIDFRAHGAQTALMVRQAIKLWARLALIALAASFTHPTTAQDRPPLVLKDDPAIYQSINPYVTAWRDPSAQLSASAALEELDRFAPLTTRYLAFGLTRDRVWLHWSARNASASASRQRWRIDIKRQYMEELDLYRIIDGKPVALLSHRQGDPFSKRDIPSRFLQKDVIIAPGETAQFLLGYRSTTSTFLKIAMGTSDAVNEVHSSEQAIDFAMNGALGAMIFLALLMIPVIGWRLGLAFALYVLAGIFYVAVADSYAMRALWPGAPWLSEPMNLSSVLLMGMAGVHFPRVLFGLKKAAPKLDRFLGIYAGVAGVAALLTPVLFTQRWFMVPAYLITPLATVIIVATGLFAIRRGYVGARVYIFGAVLVFSSFAYAFVAHVWPGQFDLDNTLDYGHFTLFTECIAFATVILMRLIALRDERDGAMQAELAATREKLALSGRLLTSQRDYSSARDLADARGQRLSELGHDIRQPLGALRAAIFKLRGLDDEQSGHIDAALDYLAGVAGDQTTSASSHASNGERKRELFVANVVLRNVHHVFAQKAQEAGVDLRLRPSELQIEADPVALMRAVSNLVANALEHGRSGSGKLRVLIAARWRSDGAVIEVRDNGPGMSEAALHHALQRGGKGDTSEGEGLGLSIVQDICAASHFRLDIQSQPGAGCRASIHITESQ